MRKTHMFLGRRGWGRNEIRLGRLIRDGEGHGDLGAGGDNGGGGDGNSDSGAGGDNPPNNTGQSLDANSFWGNQDDNSGGAPNGESAPDGTQTGADGQPGGNFATQLTERLNGLTFGEPIFTPEITEQINSGNFEGFQKRMNQQLQTAVRESLAMNVQILRPLAEQIMAQVRTEIQSTLSGRDDSSALVTDFPAARDPRVAPLIRQTFDQALKNTKGDRPLAVKQTKEMIALLTRTAAGDLDLDVAPRGAGDSGRGQNEVVNWLDELTGR